MYRRPRHRAVEALLRNMNGTVLREAGCLFGGGTAIALLLDEYRESADVDFLCADRDGFRRVREIVFVSDLDGLFLAPMRRLRETRSDRDGVRNFVDVEGTPVKLELVQEARIPFDASDRAICGIATLSLVDLWAEKFLANTDRGLDGATHHRDAIDLLALEHRFGPPPATAIAKACSAYGDAVTRTWARVCSLLKSDRERWGDCLKTLAVDPAWHDGLRAVLERQRALSG